MSLQELRNVSAVVSGHEFEIKNGINQTFELHLNGVWIVTCVTEAACAGFQRRIERGMYRPQSWQQQKPMMPGRP